METRANYVLVGGCVLAAAASIILFVFWLASNEINRAVETYYAYFTGSVAGLSIDSPVRYRGVPVGSVGAIEIDPQNVERIRVKLNLKPGTPIKIDSIASLEMTGITGGSYVEISGGTQASPSLKSEDGSIPVIKSENSTLQSLVADIPKLVGKLSDLADSANAALSPQTAKALSETVANLQKFSSSLDELSPKLQSSVDNFNRLMADLQKQVPRLVDSVQQDSVSIKTAADEFGRVAKDADGLLEENRGPIRAFTVGTLPQLRTLAETLNRVADKIEGDPQRYLFGGGTSVGVDPNRPIGAGVSTGASR